MKISTVMLAVVAGLWQALPLSAHEFWIEPESFRVAAGAPMKADIKVGDRLDGAVYSYIPPNFRRFEIMTGARLSEVEGRAGDRPALNMAAAEEGLAVVVHVTRDYKLTYDDWETFVEFCTHKDFTWAIDRHLERGLPKERVRELYSRHAKSLIAVGDGAGTDRVAGLEIEIVAGANPYTDALSGRMPVQVLYRDAPRAEAQVEVFARAPDGSVAVQTYRTDAEGRAVIDVAPGHFYLVDSVVMRELEIAEEGDPAWESLWASLTFEVPS